MSGAIVNGSLTKSYVSVYDTAIVSLLSNSVWNSPCASRVSTAPAASEM